MVKNKEIADRIRNQKLDDKMVRRFLMLYKFDPDIKDASMLIYSKDKII